MLAAVVQENADMMAGRLPRAVRPTRRLLLLWSRRAWVVALPVAITVGSALLAQWSLAAQPASATLAHDVSAPGLVHERSPASIPGMSLLTRPLRLRALGLALRRVVLDAGHGGEHLGASSNSGLHEKDLTLDLAERARRLLVEDGFE